MLTVTSPGELAAQISGRMLGDRATIVAVSGFGGAGKSTLAGYLSETLTAPSAVIPVDDFWLPDRDARSSDWSAYDWARLREQVLLPARTGPGGSAAAALRYQPLDPRDAPGGDAWREVASVSVLIVEGVGLLQPYLLPHFDITVWVDCPVEIAAERGILRDRTAYGLETAADWHERWMPNDRDFYERFRPDLVADYLLSTA